MADHFQTIYAQHAGLYDALVAREDPAGHLLAAFQGLRQLDGLDVVEMGAGTGRVTRLLAPCVRSIRAYDGSAHMLEVARAHLGRSGLSNWQVAVADNRSLPAETGSADLVVEGWSFGHLTGWYPEAWRELLAGALGEMRRVLRRGGTGILIETLGTGFETPHVVSDALGAMFAVLQWEVGCQSTWVRTDYQFETLEEADLLTRSFFGDALADLVKRESLVRLPECTGLWWFTAE